MPEDIKIKVKDADVDPLEELDAQASRVTTGFGLNVGKLGKSVVKFQFGLVTLPLNLLPAESRKHAKNTVHECFLTVKSLVDGVTGGIDDLLTKALDK